MLSPLFHTLFMSVFLVFNTDRMKKQFRNIHMVTKVY